MKHQKEPNGADLLATLVSLLAEQEGVKITYKLREEKKNGTGVYDN